jgi:hypothetical protein
LIRERLFDHAIFYEFVPLDEYGRPNPTRHWLGSAVARVIYAIVVSTFAGLWAHVIGDAIRPHSTRRWRSEMLTTDGSAQRRAASTPFGLKDSRTQGLKD